MYSGLADERSHCLIPGKAQNVTKSENPFYLWPNIAVKEKHSPDQFNPNASVQSQLMNAEPTDQLNPNASVQSQLMNAEPTDQFNPNASVQSQLMNAEPSKNDSTELPSDRSAENLDDFKALNENYVPTNGGSDLYNASYVFPSTDGNDYSFNYSKNSSAQNDVFQGNKKFFMRSSKK